MEINWLIVLLVAIVVIVLLIYLIRRNIKDEEEYVRKLNEDYPKPNKDDLDR